MVVCTCLYMPLASSVLYTWCVSLCPNESVTRNACSWQSLRENTEWPARASAAPSRVGRRERPRGRSKGVHTTLHRGGGQGLSREWGGVQWMGMGGWKAGEQELVGHLVVGGWGRPWRGIWKVALYNFIHDIMYLWYYLWYHMFQNVLWYHRPLIS